MRREPGSVYSAIFIVEAVKPRITDLGDSAFWTYAEHVPDICAQRGRIQMQPLFNRSAHSAEPELGTWSSQLRIIGHRGCPNISLQVQNDRLHGPSRLDLENREHPIKS